MVPWDDGNESNELVDDPSEDDVNVDEDALANYTTLSNISTIVAPTPYALCLPLDEYVEDNSWRTWVCNTTYTEDEELEKGMIFDSKEAVRVYHIRRNVEYRTETSNQTSTSADYMSWFLSITRQWMTPRGFVAASQYAPTAPVMTQFLSISCLIGYYYNFHNIILT